MNTQERPTICLSKMNVADDGTALYEQAIEGLLRLKTFDSQISLHSNSSSCSSEWRQELRLPPVSQILLPMDSEDDYCSSSYSPSLYSISSHSASLSSSSPSRSMLSRRRGRPKKSEMTETIKKKRSVHSFISVAQQKPRWNDAEKQYLLEAIVKEKKLDDMSTISWDRISAVVGRATKACKDQWRRELLPNIRSRKKSPFAVHTAIRNLNCFFFFFKGTLSRSLYVC
ncbi:hypothetical protein BY458DRAFT_570422 [Sporodiniella umbellata]|nr:hypothetical protein BY458DRAFT_570422 [Sporodiniella umbellata]